MAKTIKVRCSTCRKDNQITGASKSGDVWQCGQPTKKGTPSGLCGGKNVVK